MCDFGLSMAIGSTLIGGISAIGQGQAQSNAAKYNAKVADMNAELADRRAKDALARGAREEQAQRAQTAQLMGRQRAATGANGVDMSFGSPLDTIVDTAVLGELDALTIRKNAATEAFDYEQSGLNSRAEATMQRSAAKGARLGGYLSAAGTVLGGAGKAYSQSQTSKIGSIA